MERVWLVVLALCFFGTVEANDIDTTSTTESPTTLSTEPLPPRVIIVGAGMAGISAARKLETAGVRDFLVLEGSDRLGGRVRSERLGEHTVETGNMWVTGGRGNPIYDNSEWYGVSLLPMTYEDYIVLGTGSAERDVTASFDEAYEMFGPAAEYLSNKTKAMLAEDSADLDQEIVLARGGWTSSTAVDDILEQFEVEFEYSVSPRFASTKYTGSTDEFPDEEYVTLGLSKMIEGLAREEDLLLGENEMNVTHRLRLNATVTSISTTNVSTAGERVRVTTSDGMTYEAEHVIVTASLGVLHTRGIRFDPELPDWKLDAIDGFGFVHYLQIYMLFNDTFWEEDAEFILHASEYRGYFPIFTNFNYYLPNSNILQCVVFDGEARRLSRMTTASIQDELMGILRELYGPSIPDPDEILVPDFSTNPLFLGAFSHWPPLYTKSSHDALKASVGSIHFAGDYGNVEHYGRLLGAYLSGFDTADRVAKCLKHTFQCREQKPIHKARGCTYWQATNYDPDAREDDGSCKFPEKSAAASLFGETIQALVVLVTLLNLAIN